MAMKKSFSKFTFLLVFLVALTVILTGCSSSSSKRGGGYYLDDGPMAHTPHNLHLIPDATPRIEPFAPANLRPYQVMGRYFEPITDSRPFTQVGIASWYGKKFHGNTTANGERYDMYAMTAAHPTLPLPSYARVTRLDNNKSVIVRINDRGPFIGQRIIDLSYAAAAKLDMIGPGKARVRVEAITHDDIRTGRYQHQAPTPQKAYAYADSEPPAPHPLVSSVQEHPAPTRTDGFFLQFAAFRSRDNAHELAQRLNSDLARHYTQTVHINNHQNYYRVRLGPFNSRTEAVNAAAQIQQTTGQITQITYED